MRRSEPAVVALGGVAGAVARDAIEQAMPAGAGFPVATLLVNLSGALLLGVLLEALVRAGDDTGWRRRLRLLAGTGFMGAYTTYSTFAVEAVQLGRHGRGGTAVAYVVATVIGGFVATGAGVLAAGAVGGQRRRRLLPDADPDS